MELIGAKRQTVWRWPAVWNFALGGAGSGFYLISSWPALFGASGILPEFWRLVGVVLIGLGFVAVSFEAGRPLRSRFILGNLKRSWMSREALAAGCLFPVAFFTWILPHPVWTLLGICLAASFLICQGFIIYASRGVTAWNVPWIPPLFFITGLVSGAGVLLVLLAMAGAVPISLPPVLLVAIPAAVLIEAVIWMRYVRGSGDLDLSSALEYVSGRRFFLKYVISLRFVPSAILLLAAWPAVLPSGHWSFRWILMAVGLALFAGGVRQKSGIVLRAGYLRPIRLKRIAAEELRRPFGAPEQPVPPIQRKA